MKIDIKRMEIMNLEPGDTLLITLESGVTRETMDYIRHILAGAYPDCKTLVLSEVKEIHVVRELGDKND
jgi:hypothetical protein